MNRIFINAVIIAGICIAIVGGLIWGNAIFSKENPGGLDFLIPWSAARTFLEYDINPYADSASQRTQILYYGRIAGENQDPLQLSLPFPVLLFYIPFALIKNYIIARAVWMLFMEAALVAAAIFSLRLAGHRFPFLLVTLSIMLIILWLHALLPIVGGSPVIFTSLFITGGLYTLRAERDEFTGILFALALFSLRITGILIIFIFWWVITHHRWRVVAGFGMALGFLLLLSFLFMPSWVMPFINAVITKYRVQDTISTFSLLKAWSPGIGPQLAWVITTITVILFFVEWYASRQRGYRHLVWTASITLALTPFLGLPMDPLDYVVFVFPLTLILVVLSERWSSRRWGFTFILLIVFFIGLWGLVWWLLSSGFEGLLHPVLFVSIPFLCIVGLYWVRWWAIRPPRTWIDQVKGILS